MAQIPTGRLVKGPFLNQICRDCAMYFSITVTGDFAQVEKPHLRSARCRVDYLDVPERK